MKNGIVRCSKLAACVALILCPAASSGATHTVEIKQTTDSQGDPDCYVTPRVDVEAGDEVLFDMQTDGKAKKVKIKKKKDRPEKVKFGNPPPWTARKGQPAKSGKVQRDGGDAWEYDVVFKKRFFGTVCVVDPVICIKDDTEPKAEDAQDVETVDDPCS